MFVSGSVKHHKTELKLPPSSSPWTSTFLHHHRPSIREAHASQNPPLESQSSVEKNTLFQSFLHVVCQHFRQTILSTRSWNAYTERGLHDYIFLAINWSAPLKLPRLVPSPTRSARTSPVGRTMPAPMPCGGSPQNVPGFWESFPRHVKNDIKKHYKSYTFPSMCTVHTVPFCII